MTSAVLVGIWVMSICTQTVVKDRVNHFEKTGYTTEFYQFTAQSEFEYARNWYKDSQCKELDNVEKDNGTVSIGKVSDGFTEINFKTPKGLSQGWFRMRKSNEIELNRGLLGAPRPQKQGKIFTKKD